MLRLVAFPRSLPNVLKRVDVRCFSSSYVPKIQEIANEAAQARSETHDVNTIDRLLREISELHYGKDQVAWG